MDSARVARIGLRLSFLIAAAGVLAWRCRQGTSLLEVALLFTVYVVAATLWVRGQYRASVDAARSGKERLRPWTFPCWVSVPAVVVGIGLAVFGVVQNVGSALLFGVMLAYLGLGYVLMRWRMTANHGWPRRVKIAVGIVLGSVALVFVGLLALEHHGWALFAAGGGLLAAPIGLSLLAEPAIRWLQRPGHEVFVAAAAGGGAVVLVADIVIAWARVDTAWMLLGFAALALLVIAIVSSTQADIAAVIAAVTLMGVTAMSEEKPDALNPQPGQAKVLVALGDSYMSGEGAGLYYREDVDEKGKDENYCNRAPTAWAAMAGQTKRLFDSVAFLACSGARTFNVRHGQVAQYNEPGTQLDQVDALKKQLGEDFDPSLVVVSLGGNDAGFSTIGATCLAQGDCIDKRDLWERNLAKVGAALTETFGDVRDEFPNAPVLVTPYPAPIHTVGGKPVACDQVALSVDDMRFISQFLPALNATVKKSAEANRFYFLDAMERSLADAHLQLCDPDNDKRPGINFIGLRSVSGIAEQRFNPKNWYHNSLHPNERGHAAMLQVFEQWRADNPDPDKDGPGPTAPEATTTGDQIETDPPCDLVGGDQSTTVRCQEAGVAWAKGQLSDTLLWHWWGLQIIVAVLAAWSFGVGLFGWWKPWWTPRPPDG